MVHDCLLKKSMRRMHSSEKAPTASIHRFPVNDPPRFRKWCEALRGCSSIDYLNLQNARICSLHFRETDFLYANKKRHLTNTAVPSIFEPDNDRPENDTNQTRFAACRDIAIVLEDITPLLEPQQVCETPQVLNTSDGLPDVPFCRLCFRMDLPLQALFPPNDPAIGSQLATLIREVAGITIDFCTDHSSFVCHECHNLLEEMYKLIRKWQQNDLLLEKMRKKHSAADPAVRVEAPIVRLNADDEGCLKQEVVEIEQNVVTTTPTNFVEIPMERILELEARFAENVLVKEENHADKVNVPSAIIERDKPEDPERREQDPDNAPTVELDDPKIEMTQLPGPSRIPVIDLIDIEEKERLIRRAMRELRKSLTPVEKRKTRRRNILHSPSKTPKHKRGRRPSFTAGGNEL